MKMIGHMQARLSHTIARALACVVARRFIRQQDGATTVEFAASLLKTTLFGAMIALVCCYKGLTASGGSEGVGRAVNQAIVISFLAIGVIDYAFTQALLATHPELTSVR